MFGGDWIFSRNIIQSQAACGGELYYTTDWLTFGDTSYSDYDLLTDGSPVFVGAGTGIGTSPNRVDASGASHIIWGDDGERTAVVEQNSSLSASFLSDGMGEEIDAIGGAHAKSEMEIVEVASGGTFSLKATVRIAYVVQFGGTGLTDDDFTGTGSGGAVYLDDYGDYNGVFGGVDWIAGYIFFSSPDDSDMIPLIWDGLPHEHEFEYTWENLSSVDLPLVTFDAVSSAVALRKSYGTLTSVTTDFGFGSTCEIEIIPDP